MSRSFPHGRILPCTLYQGHAKLETLVVTRIDRLVKKLRDLQIVHEARENGVHLKATEQLIDRGSCTPCDRACRRAVRSREPSSLPCASG
jgi:hypothetical protein